MVDTQCCCLNAPSRRVHQGARRRPVRPAIHEESASVITKSVGDPPPPPTRHTPQSASDSQITSNIFSQMGSWHQRPLRGVRQRRRSPRVRLLQRIVAQQAGMPPGVAATRHVGSGWRYLGVPGMLGWGNKALRETRPEAAPGGGRCGGHEAGATVILRAMLRRYAVTSISPPPPHSGI